MTASVGPEMKWGLLPDALSHWKETGMKGFSLTIGPTSLELTSHKAVRDQVPISILQQGKNFYEIIVS